MRLTALFVIALLAFALAGCAGNSGDRALNESTAPPPTVSDSTGSITGLVTDDESVPLASVDLAVKGPLDAETSSDAQGHFTFNDLPAGSYQVFAQRLGYESMSRKWTSKPARPQRWI